MYKFLTTRYNVHIPEPVDLSRCIAYQLKKKIIRNGKEECVFPFIEDGGHSALFKLVGDYAYDDIRGGEILRTL
jgi:hypothetical protein